MSKATVIRKKALDLVRDQDWPGAIREYKRLVELDQSNPNVHNELADLYLKTSQKAEAYDSFVHAVDEYTRVGLHNNAVAVCKKVLRVLPGRIEVFTKLGYIRSRQGLAKEAESYYLQFLEKADAGGFGATELATLASAIAEEMKESPVVLQRLGQVLMGYNLHDDAGRVFVVLYLLCERNGDTGGMAATRQMVAGLGCAAELEAALSTQARGTAQDGTVITEQTIWTRQHTEGERIEVESTPRFTPPGQAPAPKAPEPQPAASEGPSERDLYLLRLARGSAFPRPAAATAAPAKTPPEEEADAPAQPAASAPTATATETRTSSRAPVREAIDEPEDAPVATAVPETPPAAPLPRTADTKRNGGGPMQISALLDDELGGGEEETDFRSHYDLGMAYLEMDLLAEAIREYQVASKSPQYQVKCLEMIGSCFIKQNQPKLAIRQLTKGLSLIGSDGEESLGIKYNLGLAYEMDGDAANARTFFEDVYVVDVTFRDVADKIKKLSGAK